MTKPDPSEYGSYYEKYISLVPAGALAATLETQFEETNRLFSALTEEQGGHRYAPGKWSIREMIGHMIDTERVFAYRLLRIARNDKTPLPGFEQDNFVAASDFDAQTIPALLAEFAAVRRASIALVRSLSDEALLRVGTASNNPLSARAAGYIIAGHELFHHDILKTRYLAS